MRTKLASQDGERKKFKARFVRLGKKTNYKGYSEDTILLSQVTDMETNTLVTDHLWFSYTKGFEKINLKEGLMITFEARVKSYKKGYVNRAIGMHRQQKDYKLSHPTRIEILNQDSI
jgi:hypothetical protein